MSTPGGSSCSGITGWGAKAAQQELREVFKTEQFSKKSNPWSSESRRFKALGLAEVNGLWADKPQEAGAVGAQHCRRQGLLELRAARARKSGILTLQLKTDVLESWITQGREGWKAPGAALVRVRLIHLRETEACARVICSSSCKESKITRNVCSLFSAVLAGISDVLHYKSLKFEGVFKNLLLLQGLLF